METELVTLERTQDTKGRKIYSAERRERLVAEYDASGRTQVRFAKQIGVKYMTLVTWLRQRRMGAGQRRPGGKKFEKLELPSGAAPRAMWMRNPFVS